MLVGLLKVNGHYEETEAALSDPARRGPVRDLPRQRVVIPVRAPGPEDVYAAAYAKRVLPARGPHRALRPDRHGHRVHVGLAGASSARSLELRLRTRSIPNEIRNLAREIRADADEDALINVIIPESVRHTGWRHFLHTLLIQRIKAALVAEADVVVTNVAHHRRLRALEPVTDGRRRPARDGRLASRRRRARGGGAQRDRPEPPVRDVAASRRAAMPPRAGRREGVGATSRPGGRSATRTCRSRCSTPPTGRSAGRSMRGCGTSSTSTRRPS